MNFKKPFLSVIIPIYNEQNRLKNLKKIYGYLDRQKLDYEVILVNDGSNDNTEKHLSKLSRKFKFQLITYQENKGKGFAIKTGMLAAKGQFQLFTDIDLSTPIKEFNKFLPHLFKNDVLIGSRKMRESNLKKRQPLLRELLGKGFTFLSQRTLNLFISDFTCGFKCFSKKASKKIFTKQQIKRWGFDPEILFLCSKLGFSIKEIPVIWKNNQGTKVRFPHAIFSSFLELMKIKYYDFNGYYNSKK